MKHFLVEIHYSAPLAIIDNLLVEHRKFLQTGYDRGWLLFSGPKNPRTGGIVIARAPDLKAIEKFFQDDPYYLHQAAEYTFVEFNPVKRQPFLEAWISSED